MLEWIKDWFVEYFVCMGSNNYSIGEKLFLTLIMLIIVFAGGGLLIFFIITTKGLLLLGLFCFWVVFNTCLAFGKIVKEHEDAKAEKERLEQEKKWEEEREERRRKREEGLVG